MKFTLTYEGQLRTGGSKSSSGKTQADFKQDLRQYFHPQLKRLWMQNPFLKNWATGDLHSRARMEDAVVKNLPVINGFKFVALITQAICVECWLDVRVLRSTNIVGQTPDIDNQIKVLLDGLKMPRTADEMGRSPDITVNPLYVLIQDDSLVNKITSTQDELLQPIQGEKDIGSKDVRIFIDVHIRPKLPHSDNVLFYSSDADRWEHTYNLNVPENLSYMGNGQLKAYATQCIYRIRALHESFTNWRSNSLTQQAGSFQERTTRIFEDTDTQMIIWHNSLWPRARAIKEELCNRIYGEQPRPHSPGSVAIDYGMLAGPFPLAEAAAEIELLVRRLP